MGINSKILQKLDEWQQSEGSLPEGIEFYRKLLRIQNEIEEHVSIARTTLSQSEIRDRLQQGTPLLEWEALLFDWSALQKLFLEVATAAAEFHKTVAVDFKALKDFASDIANLQEATRVWYHSQPLSPIAANHSVSEELLAALIHAAVKPFLNVHSETLIELVDQKQWRRGYCPVCGGKPDFAFLDRERGARWLLCSRCDAQWLFQRLQCPYCDAQDKDALAHFSDDNGLYRLYVCEKCRSYLKAIDLRKTDEEILPSLERVLTVDMDKQGQERGYKGLTLL
ncbi:formate dehydrogenase accessory protein FdhE [Chloroflexota bacterium]